MAKKNINFAKLKTKIALLPQKSFNVSVDRKVPVSDIKNLSDDIEKAEAELSAPHRTAPHRTAPHRNTVFWDRVEVAHID
jgi:hypothetical protein